MYRKKLLTLTLCAALAGVSMAGCGTTDTTTEVSEASVLANTITFSDSDYSSTEFTAVVDSIEGNTLTLSIMGAGGAGGSAPEMPSDGSAPSDAGDGSAPSDAGDGSAPSDAGDGSAPSDAGDGSAPSDAGDGSAPSDAGDGSAPSDAGDGSAPSDAGDGSAPSDAGDGSAPSDADSSAVPEKPEGDSNSDSSASDGSAPSATGASSDTETVTATLVINDESVLTDADGNLITLSEITEGSYLTISMDEDGNITSIALSDGASGGMGGGQSSSGVESYDALTEVTEDTTLSGETYASTGTDENAIHVYNGATAYLTNLTVSRDSDDSTGGDNSSFYGVGAALLVTDGTAYVDGGTYTTDAAGGAGIFAYGDGVVYVNGATITTTQNTSGGIHAAGGGTLYAYDCDVTTSGESSAAIRSDRGGGTMVVDGGSYVSNGTGSPAVYCTADITVNDATLTANGSEAICLEGLNTLRLYNCDLTGNMSDDDQNDCTWNVIVYQSMSGDAEDGNGTFSMTGGTLTAKNGGIFYTTNTESTFYLSGVDITYADENDFFLRCTGNANARGWGSTGSNGADCTFTADGQEMEGDIIYDSISNLDFYMENGSTLTGAFVDDESCAGNGGDGEANLYISSDSTWVVTGDSELTSLYNEGTIVDASGKTVSIVGTDGTVYVSGSSSYTITVDNYSTSASFSGATEGESYSDFKVENPF